jgi:hypothetical protein
MAFRNSMGEKKGKKIKPMKDIFRAHTEITPDVTLG